MAPIAILGAQSNPCEVLLHPNCTQICRLSRGTGQSWRLVRRSDQKDSAHWKVLKVESVDFV